MRKKSLTVMAKKSERDNSLQKKLNRLTVTITNPKYLEYKDITVLSLNAIFGDDISECLNLLSLNELQFPPLAQKVSSTENRKIYYNEINSKSKSLIKEEEKESEINEEQNNSSNKKEKELINLEKDKEYQLDKLLYQKYKVLILDKYQLPFSPSFIRIKVNLLYGSYSILSFRSAPYFF